MEIRWVPDNSGMRVKSSKQQNNENMGRLTKEEEEEGSKQSTDKQSMDDKVEKKTMEKMKLDREDL